MSTSEIINKAISEIESDIVELKKEFNQASTVERRARIENAITYANNLIKELQEEQS